MNLLRACIPAAAIAVCGCGHDLSTGTDASSPGESPETMVGAPNIDSKTSLKLVRDGNEFSLGDTIDTVYQVFGRPKPSYELTELPPGFQAPYTAHGWEAATEGVGAILYRERVVAIMRQLPRAKWDDLTQMVDVISKENPQVKPLQITGDRVVFYFWDQAPQRIMISALSTKGNRWNITEALGDDTVLDALGVNPATSKNEQPKIDRLLRSRKE